MIDIDRYKLPRALEDSLDAAAILKLFQNTGKAGLLELPVAACSEAVQAALRKARRTGRLRRGFDTAVEILNNERRGLAKLTGKTGAAQGGRVSRLLLVTGDGSPRFYREVAHTLERHAPRVLGLRLQADSAVLGELLYGEGAAVKLLLVDHKEAVCDVLSALAKGQ